MKKIFGNTTGLKPNQLRQIERLYRRAMHPDVLVSPELAREMARLTHLIRRQIGLMVNRRGKVVYVVVGDHQKILIPNTDLHRAAPGRLMGLRCVHTHLRGEPLSPDDLTDLVLLRLDLMAAITLKPDGTPAAILAAHVLPGGDPDEPYLLIEPLSPHNPDFPCIETIQALEDEMAQQPAVQDAQPDREAVLLVSVTTAARREAQQSLHELTQLAESAGLVVVDTILQQRDSIDARFLLGSGKIRELALTALQKKVALIIFDQELNPSQIRSITDQIEFKVIDRTQLILDIFAQRAQTREGKLQVELAQLKYMLPRLVAKNTAMSRLTGGIGGRGPGETKLEINRRRVRDRINRLEQALVKVQAQRRQQRAQRNKRQLPIVSIIGYTNAGKSTLLNTLTHSSVHAENRLFATLDPSSRRLRFPRDLEVIITDTVGFIRDLPHELMTAFRATLEELENADLLLHVIDISSPRHLDQIRSVEHILADLGLAHIKTLRVLNKQDKISPETREILVQRLGGIPVTAHAAPSLRPLIAQMQKALANTPRETTLQPQEDEIVKRQISNDFEARPRSRIAYPEE